MLDIFVLAAASCCPARDLLPAHARPACPACRPQVQAGARRAESKGVVAAEVAAVIHEALTAERPRARYLVGGEAKLQMLLRRLLPDRLWDPLLMGTLAKAG
jgi:hypothetical protein